MINLKATVLSLGLYKQGIQECSFLKVVFAGLCTQVEVMRQSVLFFCCCFSNNQTSCSGKQIRKTVFTDSFHLYNEYLEHFQINLRSLQSMILAVKKTPCWVWNQINENGNRKEMLCTSLNKQNSAMKNLYAALVPYPPLAGRENREWEFSEWRWFQGF